MKFGNQIFATNVDSLPKTIDMSPVKAHFAKIDTLDTTRKKTKTNLSRSPIVSRGTST
jgi:hypothetical protein